MLTAIGEHLNEMPSPRFAADAWLNKPFEFTELDARIRETLGRYEKSVPVGGAPAGGEVEERVADAEDEDEPPARAPSAPKPRPPARAKAKPAARSKRPTKKRKPA